MQSAPSTSTQPRHKIQDSPSQLHWRPAGPASSTILGLGLQRHSLSLYALDSAAQQRQHMQHSPATQRPQSGSVVQAQHAGASLLPRDAHEWVPPAQTTAPQHRLACEPHCYVHGSWCARHWLLYSITGAARTARPGDANGHHGESKAGGKPQRGTKAGTLSGAEGPASGARHAPTRAPLV